MFQKDSEFWVILQYSFDSEEQNYKSQGCESKEKKKWYRIQGTSCQLVQDTGYKVQDAR